MVLRHLDLFSGIGGFSLGLEATGGFETVAFCDIEEFPRKVLQKHWPGVKQYEDIKELNYEKLKADGLLPIDILTGGYPCQPFSIAGRKKGEKDPRHLWPEYFRLIKELRPTWVIGENVSGHIKLGLDTVLENLESEGYSVRTFSISASSIGANHQRERIWIVANSNSSRNKGEKSRSIREKDEKEERDRQVDSTTRFPDGTDSIVTKNKSESEVEHVEDTRRSLRQGSEFRGENENEIRQGNANISERSSEASEFDVANSSSGRRTSLINERSSTKKNKRREGDIEQSSTSSDVANTEGKYNSEQEGKIKSRGKIIEGRETEIRSESTGRSNTLADTSTHRSFDESERKIRDMEEKSSGKKETRNKSTIRSSTCSTEMANTDINGLKRGSFEISNEVDAREDTPQLRRESSGKTIRQSNDGRDRKESRIDENISGSSNTGEGEFAPTRGVRGLSSQSSDNKRISREDNNQENNDRALVQEGQSRIQSSKHGALENNKTFSKGSEIQQGDDNTNEQGMDNVANTKSSQRNGNEINREHSATETQEELGVRSSISRTQGGSPWEGWWDIEPDVGRVAHGIPVRAHRLKGLGNSLVPTIPFYIGTIILEVMKDDG